MVIEFDAEEREYIVHIFFMVGARKPFRWPEKEDKLWKTERDSLCSLDDSVR